MSGDLFRNYAAALTSPTAWIGILLIFGTILIWTKKQKIGKWLLTFGVLLFVMFSFDPITEIFLNSYENKYPAFKAENLNPSQKINYVVVLAGGFVPYPPFHPLTTLLTRHTLARVIEGIKIHNELENSILVFSGKGWSSQSEASAMRELAVKLGVKSEKILLEEESTNTLDHTFYLKKILNDQPFVLVTSAIHMPRAMGLFLKAGYKPIPAPTAHMLLGEYELFNMKVPFARGDNLEAIDFWFNEFAAITRETIKGNM